MVMLIPILISAVIILVILILLFLRIAIKRKVIFIILLTALLGFTIFHYLPKKLYVPQQGYTYMTIENGSKEIDDDEKERLINIINKITLYKGAKHRSFLQSDVSTLHIVSDEMYLSDKKVNIAFFNLLAGEKYGDVQIDYTHFYFEQSALYDELNKDK